MSNLCIRTTRRDISRGCMFRGKSFLTQATIMLVLAAGVFNVVPACADDGFPFGLEMTLDVARQPGSKRLPTLEIGDSGEARLELWCKGGKGQFSVAGNTENWPLPPLPRTEEHTSELQSPFNIVSRLLLEKR